MLLEYSNNNNNSNDFENQNSVYKAAKIKKCT